ncbi:MAG: glycosyltransferase family 2 protein [Lachnospiraceae bacterium]|nr:glycosyltransferase family 2 protein [Lachnospiraceae bacterium]
MEKILTVVMAAYNMEKYLSRSLGSIAAALDSSDDDLAGKLEVLVIDDGSTDGTLEEAGRFVQRYPHTIRLIHKENKGYGSVINRALCEARGLFFKLLDADDEYDASGFKKLMHRLEHCTQDAVVTPFIKDTGVRRIIKDDRSHLKAGAYNLDTLEMSGMIMMHSLTVRTECLRKVSHRLPEKCLYTDTEFAAMALCGIDSVYVSHTPVYIHRLDRPGQSVDIRIMVGHYMEHERVIFRICGLYVSIDERETGKRDIIMSQLLQMVFTQLKLYYLKSLSRLEFIKSRRFLVRLDKRVPGVICCLMKKDPRVRFFVSKAAPVLYPFLHFCLRLRYRV